MTKKDLEQVLQRLKALEGEVLALRAEREASPPKTHTIDEAAKLLGKTPYWVRVACQKHRIPHTRVGQTIRLTDAHIRQILAEGEGRSYHDARAPLAAAS